MKKLADVKCQRWVMKAWSDTVNKKEYTLPLIATKRDEYLQANLEKMIILPQVSGILIQKSCWDYCFMIFRARSKLALQFYFSQNELKNVKKEFEAKTDKKLSTKDVLCTHLFTIVSELDSYNKKRYSSIAVDIRNRVNMPQNHLGNAVTSTNMLTNRGVDPLQLANDLRTAVDNFQRLHMNYFSTKEYIEQKGGAKKLIDLLPQVLTQ
ncbi:MAG: hypothetical protein SVM80_00860 [Halobacteriota archaeon]|nr:hypothetical protein [Halobacteriota archaeon]